MKSNNICNNDHARGARRKQISPLKEEPNWNSFSEQDFKHLILLLFCLWKWNTTRKARIWKTRWKTQNWNCKEETTDTNTRVMSEHFAYTVYLIEKSLCCRVPRRKWLTLMMWFIFFYMALEKENLSKLLKGSVILLFLYVCA